MNKPAKHRKLRDVLGPGLVTGAADDDPSGIGTYSQIGAQFGYGLGFAAYLVFMLRMADGRHPIAHFAIGTGFMALGMMLPGMAAGWLQAQLGYLGFFGWVCVATLLSFGAVAALRLDADGRPVPTAA